MCLLKILCSGCPFGKHLSMKFKGQVGLYRDDGLAVCKATAKQIEKTKQEVSEIFKSKGGGGGGVALERIFFLVGPKDPKISALTNIFGLIFRSHTKPHNKA